MKIYDIKRPKKNPIIWPTNPGYMPYFEMLRMSSGAIEKKLIAIDTPRIIINVPIMMGNNFRAGDLLEFTATFFPTLSSVLFISISPLCGKNKNSSILQYTDLVKHKSINRTIVNNINNI